MSDIESHQPFIGTVGLENWKRGRTYRNLSKTVVKIFEKFFTKNPEKKIEKFVKKFRIELQLLKLCMWTF